MASPPNTGWRLLRRFAAGVAVTEGPRIVRTLQHSPSVQRGLQRGRDLVATATSGAAATRVAAGRPVVDVSAPSAQRARRVAYCPDLDGAADCGEVVWAWVIGDDADGRDCPVLIVGRDRHTLLGLAVTRQARRHGASCDALCWVGVGPLPWTGDEPGVVRIDRVLEVPEEGIRREGAMLDRHAFDAVAARLRTDYRWW